MTPSVVNHIAELHPASNHPLYNLFGDLRNAKHARWYHVQKSRNISRHLCCRAGIGRVLLDRV